MVPLAAPPESIVVADYGASEGKNSLAPIGAGSAGAPPAADATSRRDPSGEAANRPAPAFCRRDRRAMAQHHEHELYGDSPA